MKFAFTPQGTAQAFGCVGIKQGDIVLVHSDLRALGMPSSLTSPHELLPFYRTALQNAVGVNGTLAVPAYFYEYARFGIPFDVDRSPVSLQLGSFSRYLASQPGRIRSCNPLQSLAALGRQAEALAGGDSLAGYGACSPWQRLWMMHGKILFIGLTIQPMTYVHHIEQLYGVPHMYYKIFSIPVFRSGKKLPGQPISAVRYLEYDVEYDLSPFEKELLKQGFLKMASIGKGSICCVGAREAYEVGIACLQKDPYFFLKHPPRFVPGKIPTDGATGPLKEGSA